MGRSHQCHEVVKTTRVSPVHQVVVVTRSSRAQEDHDYRTIKVTELSRSRSHHGHGVIRVTELSRAWDHHGYMVNKVTGSSWLWGYQCRGSLAPFHDDVRMFKFGTEDYLLATRQWLYSRYKVECQGHGVSSWRFSQFWPYFQNGWRQNIQIRYRGWLTVVLYEW